MKKTMWKLTVLLLAVMMCVAFVGCTTEKENPPADGQTTEGTEGDKTTGETEGDKTTGETENEKEEEKEVSPEELVSDVVTKEEWMAAFSMEKFENVKADITVTMSGTINHQEFTYKQTQTTVICGNLLHLTQTTEGSESYLGQVREQYEMIGIALNMDAYFDMETKVMYQKNDQGEWETSTPSETVLTLCDFRSAFQAWRDQYEDMMFSEFQYNETSGSYCDSDQNLIWKFKAGRLKAMISTSKYDTSTFFATQRTVTSYTYGGQSVTLPEVK